MLSLLGIITSCAQPTPPAIETPPTATIPPEPTETPAGIWIDPTAELTPISPLVYGTNYGPWQAVTVENQPAFEQSGLKFLRFPGGRWGDENKIRDYQVRQLMTHVEQIDGDVTISARLLGGTPEEAADLVRLVNDEMGHNVHYWSIGNEPSLYIDLQKAAGWDTVFYNEQWRLFADAMREADPDIAILGPNTHQFRADETTNPKDPNGLDWMREFLRANGDNVDVVTFHRYPFPINKANPLPTPDQLRDNSQEWDEIIPTIRALILEETGREIPIGIMEINSNWSDVSGGEATPDSHINAIWWGDVLMRMIQQDVHMVTHFALQNKISGWAMLGRVDVRPTYYTYQIYKQLGETKVASGSDERYVNVLAATRESDGALTVLLINLAEEAIIQPLEIAGSGMVSAAEVWQFSSEHNTENLGSQSFEGSIELPGESMTLLVIPDN